LENRLFRRDTFAWYERERIPQIVDTALDEALRDGQADLLPLARRTMMTLSVDVAGVDVDMADRLQRERFAGLMDRLARASTVAHAVGDKAAIVADGDAALNAFKQEFFDRSAERRHALIAAGATADDLPRDVLTTLLLHHDDLALDPDTLLREIAYYPWVGSHSTSNQFVHAMHHIFEWIAAAPLDRPRLITEPALLQRFVHESLRLHPASPVALRQATEALRLRSGIAIEAGERVAISVADANRDPLAVGPFGDRFDPFRPLAEGVAPWGLSFGHGSHSCLGRELAGGIDPATEQSSETMLLGAIAVMAAALLRAGARPDPNDPARLDAHTTRVMWARYPVVFSAG
jgi:cytochrome P450